MHSLLGPFPTESACMYIDSNSATRLVVLEQCSIYSIYFFTLKADILHYLSILTDNFIATVQN